MKLTILILVVLLTFLKSNGTNYFLSSSSGNDLQDGKSANTAWQTTSKLNSTMNSLQPGDSVFFKCNDTFNGQIYITKSGTATKNIYFGSYGSGKKPMISGTTNVTNWTQSKTNIWEASSADCGSKVSNFFINGIPQQIGRWPNVNDPDKGYLSYESSGINQITDNQLTNTIDWTGAEAVVRRVRWVLGRLTIKSHTASTLQFSSNTSFSNGFGYFIQNDPKTLDQQGEWYYNPTNKKFSLFSVIDPNTLITTATKLDYVIKLNAASYITLENIQFIGSVSITMDVNNCNWLTIRDIELNYSGENGMRLNGSNNVLFESNLINHTNNNAFVQTGCNDFVMRNNRIINTAMSAGMGLGGDNDYNAVTLGGTNLQVEYNTIDSVGYVGMRFSGDAITIKNNVISNFCITKDDGGGLYTWSQGTPVNYSRKLIGNIVINAIGAPEGTGGSQVAAEGIYIDDRSANVDIIGNSVYQCGNNGIYVHNSNHINIHNNTIYDNGIQILMRHDNAAATFPITSCVVDSNVFVSRTADQMVASYETIDKSLSFPDMGTFNSNSYCRPMDDNLTIHTKYINGAQVNETLTLNDWQTNFNKDLHSNKSPIALAQYVVNEAISSNYFLNSDFESNISGWSNSSKYGNGRIALASGQGNPGNALKASFISSSGKADGYMIVSSGNFEMTQGKTYRLRFSAKCSLSDVSIKMVPRKNGATNKVAADKDFVLGTSFTDFETLIVPDMTETLSTIQFEIMEFRGNVWFDNMEIVEVDVEKTNPDDYILFEYNASNSDKSISIPDDYVDTKGKPVSGNIILKPYSSVILFKKLNTSIGLLPEATVASFSLYPNPAANQVTVNSENKIISISISDINGRLIKSYKGSGATELTLFNLPKSGLYLIQVQTEEKSEYKKLIIRN